MQVKCLKRIGVIALAAAGLTGCSSDPAFWDAVAQGLNEASYDLANAPVCTWTERYGQVCQPAYTTYPQPIGPLPASYYTDRYDRDRDRGGRHGGRRDGDGRHRRGKD